MSCNHGYTVALWSFAVVYGCTRDKVHDFLSKINQTLCPVSGCNECQVSCCTKWRQYFCSYENGYFTWRNLTCCRNKLLVQVILCVPAFVFIALLCFAQVIMCISRHLGSLQMTRLSCLVPLFLQHQASPTTWFACSFGITCTGSTLTRWICLWNEVSSFLRRQSGLRVGPRVTGGDSGR